MVEAPEEDEELAFKPTSGERRTGPRRKEEGGSRMILWLALVGVVLIIVPVAGFLIYSAVSGKKKSTEDEKTKRTPVRIDGTIPRALQMALQNAKPGERIWLRGEIREANLAVRTNDVTIEADPELAAGKKVVWKCPDQGNYKQAKLLIVQSVSGFTMRGITLDGNKQTEGLVVLYGRCSGAKLENLTFQNSRQFGLMILNCEASKESPIECEDLTFVTEPAQSAIRFGMPNQTAIQKIGHLAFRKITFNGPGQKVTASRAGPFEKTQYIDEKTIALPEGVKIE